MRTLVVILVIVGSIMDACPQWQELTQGPDHHVRALAFDTVNNRLYAVGHFTEAGGQVVNATAYFENGQWYPMGDGLENANAGVIACVVRNDSVMISGFFQSMLGVPNTKYVALWNGSEWVSIGGIGAQGMAWGILANDEGWTLAGNFSSIGGAAHNRIARYKDGEWEAICNYPDMSGWASYSAVAKYQDQYIFGGNINGDFPELNEIGVLINDTLRPMGTGILGDSWVNDMVVYDDKLFEAGEFYAGWGNPGSGVMVWDGENWSDPVPGVQYIAQGHDLDVYDGKLFIGGRCIIPGTPGYYTLAMYTPGEICLFGKNLNAGMHAIAATDTHLFVAPNTPSLVVNGEALNWLAMYDLSQGFDTCITLATNVRELDQAHGKLLIFPNPGSGLVNIQLTGASTVQGPVQVMLYDPMGRLVSEVILQRNDANTWQFPISNISSGAYLMRVRTRDGGLDLTRTFLVQ